MKTLADILHALVIRAIEAEVGNSAEQKARIMIAREHGHLSDQETTDWLALLELEHA